MRRNSKLSSGLITVLIAIGTILIAIPVTVVTGYIPPSVTAHKPTWIAGLSALAIVLAALARLSARSSAPRPVPVPAERDPAPIVVGEIPRKPEAFVARETAARLAAAVSCGQVAVLCAVTGLRGVGKTQVAAAYARDRIAVGWGLVAWVNAEPRDVLLDGLARVARALGVADPEGDSLESARRLQEHLETRADPGLLVFDNATDPDGLRPFLPASGGTQVVVTSNDRAFVGMGVPVDVTVFTRPETLGYLAERTGLADETGADAVAAELGDLPLGLAQAAATIIRRRLTYPRYLELLSRVPVEQVLGRVPGDDYPRSTAAALLLSVEAAEDNDPAGTTRHLLRVVAALSPDGVPRGLLAGIGDEGGGTLVDAALERCAAGSLLAWSEAGDAVIMHRLVGRVLRERDQAAGRWAGTVTAALDLLEPLLFPEDQAWSRRAEGADLAVQAEALWEAGTVGGTAEPELAARLLRARSWAVRQMMAAADLGRAIGAGARTLADAVRVLGPDHPDTLTSRHNLADACQATGRLGEAIPLFGQALADRERVLGPDHPDTLRSRNGLATAYQDAGRLGEAIPLFGQALADRERVLGPDHPDTLRSRNGLATAYRDAGRLGEAIPLFGQALADRERVLGPDHPDTLRSRNGLATAYRDAGRLGEAIPLFGQALADRERVLGPDHPDTLVSRNGLALAYRDAGRLGEAIPLFERAVADCERVLGQTHPGIPAFRNGLATAYRDAGRLGEAIPLFERTLADRERVLGPDHPDTLRSRNDLAYGYRSARRLGEAIPLFERAVADRERVLGPDHPDTLVSRNELALAYRDAGRLGEAIPLFERTLADCERVLGQTHPDTLQLGNNLATAYRDAGRLDEAILLFERTLADRERVLGPDHPDTLVSRNNLAGAYRDAGRLGEAIPLFERTLADRVRVLGDYHPDTLTSRNSLETAYDLRGRLGGAIPPT